VVYPFRQSTEYADLLALYELIARLDADKGRYTRPITVIDRKTTAAMEGNRAFHEFRKHTVSRYSEISTRGAWTRARCGTRDWDWPLTAGDRTTFIGSSPAISITAAPRARKC